MLGCAKELQGHAFDMFQSIFYYAAYFAAVEGIAYDEKMARGGSRAPGLAHRGASIIAKDLCMTYPGAKTPSLRDINLTIEPGETLAVVGANGGGKTTLVKTLLGLYPHDGQLFLNGEPASNVDLTAFHSRTACLFQDFGKYELSIRDNIGIGCVECINEDDTLMAAAGEGGALDIVTKYGLDCLLDDRACNRTLEKAEDKADAEVRNTSTTDNGWLSKLVAFKNRISHAFFPSYAEQARQKLQDAGHWSTWRHVDKYTALSGGQWQRVALARAFLRAKQADLVVFECVLHTS